MKYIVVLLIMCTSLFLKAQGHKINFDINGLSDSIAFVVYPYSGQQYILDTLTPNEKGEYVFQGEDTMEGGLYFLMNAEKQVLFQFLVDEQQFTLRTVSDDPTAQMKVEGSEENKIFYEYWQHVGKFYEKMGELRKEEDEESKAKLKEMNNEVNAYRKDFMSKHPERLITKLLWVGEEPSIPEDIKKNDTLAYRYYKKHYFDNIDFNDARIIRSPLLHDRIQRYLDKMVSQDPDTLVKEVLYVISLGEGNYDMYRYLVSSLSVKYEKSKQMCIDKVFYAIIENHYKSGKTKWIGEVQMAKILQRGKDLKPCRCGLTGNNLIMKDSLGEFKALHDVEEEYTVVVFWSSTCGHCKSMMPKLKKFHEDYKESGVEVYAVNIEDESESYIKYLRKMDFEFINVQDTTHSTYFRYYYNVYMTPVIYLLDKDKKIVGKQLAVDSVAKLIDQIRGVYSEDKDYGIYYVPSGKDKH